MELRRHNGLSYYVFEILAPYPRLKHGVFARYGPKSLGGELTFSFRDDLPDEKVAEGIALAEEALGLGPTVMVGQTHSKEIFWVDKDAAYYPRAKNELISGYDALCALPGSTLLIKIADCQGVLLYHPKTGGLALVHSGWRGSRQNIVGETVQSLANRLSVPPKELVAAVSPSLGPCCMEFKGYMEELPEEFWAYRIPGTLRFDFWAITLSQLTRAGVKKENVQIAGICSKCHPDFFSYRGGDAGRFGFMAGAL